MKKYFHKFGKTGILVIGDIIVDHYVWGNVQRISPEAPVPVVEVSRESLLLGGAANVAHNIVSLGGRVFLSGVIGMDETGRTLMREMEKKGINTDGIVGDDSRPTIVKTRIIAHNQQVVRIDREVRIDVGRGIRKSLLTHVADRLPEIRAIIISDYRKGLITKSLIKNLLEIAGPDVFVAVDPKIGYFDYYRDVDLITPNIDEAASGSGITIKDEKTLIRAGRGLLKRLRCKAVLITKGAKGMSLFESNGKVTHIPTFAREVYDVTGAGDTVIAACVLFHSAGAPLREAAVYANHAAGFVVSEVGTAVVTPDDIISSLKKSGMI